MPLFQNEGRCSAFDMEIIFHSHANKTHFHKKGCAPSFVLKVRVCGTRKWPIRLRVERQLESLLQGKRGYNSPSIIAVPQLQCFVIFKQLQSQFTFQPP